MAGCGHLEGGHTDNAGLGVVGRIVPFRRAAGGRRQADDGTGAVRPVRVQRNRLLKLGVQTGTTGDREEMEWFRFHVRNQGTERIRNQMIV